MKIFSLFLILLITSCTYPMDKQIVMDKEGNYYMLEEAPCANCYRLKYIRMSEIDSIKMKVK